MICDSQKYIPGKEVRGSTPDGTGPLYGVNHVSNMPNYKALQLLPPGIIIIIILIILHFSYCNVSNVICFCELLIQQDPLRWPLSIKVTPPMWTLSNYDIFFTIFVPCYVAIPLIYIYPEKFGRRTGHIRGGYCTKSFLNINFHS